MNIKDLKPTQGGKYNQGYFIPHNPDKYKGDPGKIIYRSEWERRFMQWADIHPNIVLWASEEFKIKYWNPVHKMINGQFEGSWANYYVDFFIQIKKGEALESWLIEVKPNMQVPTSEHIAKLQKKMNESRMTEKQQKSYNLQMKTLLTNRAKFLAAKKFAEERGCRFAIADENFLF